MISSVTENEPVTGAIRGRNCGGDNEAAPVATGSAGNRGSGGGKDSGRERGARGPGEARGRGTCEGAQGPARAGGALRGAAGDAEERGALPEQGTEARGAQTPRSRKRPCPVRRIDSESFQLRLLALGFEELRFETGNFFFFFRFCFCVQERACEEFRDTVHER